MSLERALELAERGRGTTHPNPVVGAVIVRDGEVVGEGWHERAGGPHAEVVALEQAGERARGATMYVTLEPCAHHGRTPPCADAWSRPAWRASSSARRSRPAHRRPRDRAAARGRRRGRGRWTTGERAPAERGVAHLGGARAAVRHAEARGDAGRPRGRPGSRWITGEESRRLVHELRAASDAVAVGMGTARADRPALTARDVERARQPRRLVFGRGPLPEGIDLELRRRAARGGARPARRAGRAVAAARGRADARRRRSCARTWSTSCCSSSRRRWPARGRHIRPRRVGPMRYDVSAEARRRRAPDCLCPRALTYPAGRRRLVTAISEWLAGHWSDERLEAELAGGDPASWTRSSARRSRSWSRACATRAQLRRARHGRPRDAAGARLRA